MNHLSLCFIKQTEFDQMTVFTFVMCDTFYSSIGFELVFFFFFFLTGGHNRWTQDQQ